MSRQSSVVSPRREKLKVVYTDVDGTLVGPGGCLFWDSQKNYTLEPAKTIVAALEKGLDIVMISGRNRDQLKEDARIMGFKNYIAEAGAEIVYDLGRKFVQNIGDFKVTKETVFETIAKCGAPQALFERYKGKLEYHTPWSAQRYYTHLLRGRVEVDEVNDFLQNEGFADLKFVDNGRIFVKSETLEVTEPHAYHLLPKATDKGSAIRKDQEIRKIEKEETIAIGDSEADLPLANEVGTLFLVANAIKDDPELPKKAQKFANVVVTKNERGLGWAEAVNSVLKS